MPGVQHSPAAFDAAVAAEANETSGCLMAVIIAWPLTACWGPLAGRICTTSSCQCQKSEPEGELLNSLATCSFVPSDKWEVVLDMLNAVGRQCNQLSYA